MKTGKTPKLLPHVLFSGNSPFSQVRLPRQLFDRLAKVARDNKRSPSREAEIAVENYLADVEAFTTNPKARK